MSLPKLLIAAGILLIFAGLLVWLAPRVPGLNRFGSLPGDIRIETEKTRFYFPWVSCLVLSLVLTLLSYLFRRFKG